MAYVVGMSFFCIDPTDDLIIILLFFLRKFIYLIHRFPDGVYVFCDHVKPHIVIIYAAWHLAMRICCCLENETHHYQTHKCFLHDHSLILLYTMLDSRVWMLVFFYN